MEAREGMKDALLHSINSSFIFFCKSRAFIMEC